MNSDEILDRIYDIAEEQSGRLVPRNRSQTLEAFGYEFDELDLIEFVMTLEEEFGIKIEDEEYSGWTCVGEVATLVSSKPKVVDSFYPSVRLKGLYL